jgi:hypothetical protein
VKVTKINTKNSKATIAAAKKAVANATKKNGTSNSTPALPKSKSKFTTSVSSGRVVLKVTTNKKKNNKFIVFPGQQALPVTNKKPVASASKAPRVVITANKKNTPSSFPASVVKGTAATAAAAANKRKATATANAGMHTAEAIARDITHPKREEINELLKAYSRGWIPAAKFNEVLQRTLF